ncbi:TonB-dependent receptor [Halarcobacter mediterraneus]|uniref:TonB-dependent receptor n=1 Tax=Halarcobacter mediterraneus TaxID=2023153 RepID=A0A4Q1AQK9_9BACT|nr:TonB-dependent receptor plug domain-containing protein [Halarcobacter mediterraneus]RXK11693.1 TonB-dependent receptor [Halarcobacter mediterraneus]
MKIFVFLLISFFSVLNASTLSNLLKEYEKSSKNSLETIDEKMGYVIVYTKEELELMQYENLSDVLKELPANNLNINKMGLNTISLPGTKTDVTGFFRLYINDHEVSSIYNQSPSLSWSEMPISLIDHIEIYYGEGSFNLGNATGVQFIRVYTKSAKKENGNELYLSQSNKSSNSQSITHSSILENGWTYLFHLTNNNDFPKNSFDKNNLKNDKNSQYLFFNLNSEYINFDMGYTNLQKDVYTGYSSDFMPDDGLLESKNFFLHLTNYLSEDKTFKSTISYDVNNYKYEESNKEGLFLVPIIDLKNINETMPKYYNEDLKFTKVEASLSKKFFLDRHKIYSALNVATKKYKVNNRESINFLNQKSNISDYTDYNKENIYSFMIEEDFKLKENLHLIANYKISKYERKGSTLENDVEYLYRFGGIYLPTEYLGFKTFYTRSYLAPNFFNIDFKEKSENTFKTQKYKYFNFESVLAFGNSKFNIDYYRVKIDDFAYNSPIGFINIEDAVKTNGVILEYEYKIDKKSKIKLNYYKNNLNRNSTNSYEGGYLKYSTKYERFSYFTSLIYKSAYKFLDLDVANSYNLNMGFTYNYTKNLSINLKGQNLLNKPTSSLFNNGIGGDNISINDYNRKFIFGIRWLF